MQIKWLDKRGGQIKLEKWESISEAKALDMLRRYNAQMFDTHVAWLRRGEDVETKSYVLRDDNLKGKSNSIQYTVKPWSPFTEQDD